MLKADSESLVASLEGEWGTGKSSVIEMICKYYEQLPSKEAPIVIRFNPWMFSELNNMVQEFLLQFASQINVSNSTKTLKKAGNALLKYASILDAAKFIPGAKPWASIMQNAFKATGDAAHSIGSLGDASIEKQRDDVVSALGKLKKPIVVIIDDLDRLVAKEVYTILRLVKSVSDFPRVSYLLAYSHGHVVDSLEDCGIRNGSGYLEKIVQIRLPLPRILKDDLISLLNNALKGYGEEPLEEFPGERERWQEYAWKYIIPLLDNPRVFIRLANRIGVNYPIVKGEISFADYCCLEALSVVEPLVYDHVRENPLAYVGSDNTNFFSTSKAEIIKSKPAREDALKLVKDSRRREIISDMLSDLFPGTTAKDENELDRHDHASRTSGRIANYDNYEFAFYFSKPKHIASINDLRIIWNEPSKRKLVYQEIRKRDQAKKLLSIVDELIFDPDNKYDTQDWGLPEDVENFLQEYVSYIEAPELPVSIGGWFEHDYRQYISRMTYWIINRVAARERIKLAKQMCSNKALLVVSEPIVNRNLREHGEFGEDDREDKPVFTKKQADDLKALWRKACEETLSAGDLWESKLIRSVLMTLVHIGEVEMIRTALASSKVTNAGRYSGLSAMLGRGAINDEDYIVWSHEKLDVAPFQKLMKTIKKQKDWDTAKFQAVTNAYSNPSKCYYVKNGEECDPKR